MNDFKINNFVTITIPEDLKESTLEYLLLIVATQSVEQAKRVPALVSMCLWSENPEDYLAKLTQFYALLRKTGQSHAPEVIGTAAEYFSPRLVAQKELKNQQISAAAAVLYILIWNNKMRSIRLIDEIAESQEDRFELMYIIGTRLETNDLNDNEKHDLIDILITLSCHRLKRATILKYSLKISW